MGTAWFNEDPDIKTEFKDLKIERPPQIITAYWVDANGKKTTKLLYGDDNIVRIYVEGKNLKDKEIKIKILESDSFDDDGIHEFEKTATKDKDIFSFNLDENIFDKGGEAFSSFYFNIKMDEQIDEEFCNNSNDYLKVSVVRYIPKAMRKQGWNMGASLQEEWFSRIGKSKSSNRPTENSPVTDLITMNWVLGFPRAKAVYDKIIKERTWINEAAQVVLSEKIKKMKKDSKLVLPQKEGELVDFGVFDPTLDTYKHSVNGDVVQSPIYDKYYFQFAKHSESTLSAIWNGASALDDMFATLGDFVFRVIGGGTITKKGGHYIIQITTLGIYVRDNFDFNDVSWKPNQPLGYWNIVTKEVATTPTSGHFYISNKSYREYRKEFEMGEDFTVYSDIKYEPVYGSFIIPISSLNKL